MLRAITGYAIRRPVVVLTLWLIVLAGGFGAGAGIFQRLSADVGAVPGSESDTALHRLADAPDEPARLTALVHGMPATDPAVRDSVAAAVADVRAMPGIAAVADPVPSTETGKALLIVVTLRPERDADEAAEAAAERLHRIEAPEVVVSGGPITDAEFNVQAQRDVARAEMVSLPVVLVLLLLVFGGLVAAGLPLVIAVVGIGSTFGILYAFSLVSDVSVYAVQVTTMLSVGLAVDYALLMVSRFREERATAPDVPTAVARTVATAGRTVLFAGLTVTVALTGLLVFPDPFLRSMGLAGAAVVAVDMVAALTLLPALLVLLGRRIPAAKPRTRAGVFAAVARVVQRRPVLTLVATVGVLATLAIPVLDLRLSPGDARLLPTSTETRRMWDASTVHFPEHTAPNDIVVVASTPSDDPELASLRDRVAAVAGVTGVEVVSAGPELTVLRAAPGARPEQDAAAETVAAIRALPAPFEVVVTGEAARLVDYRQMLAERLPWAILVVVLATLVLLFALTGSVLLPVKAVLTNVLSLGAALGVVVWVFQQGHLAGLFGTVRLDATHLTIPVLVGAIAFGLSVDYEVFLLSRIRERWLAGADPQQAVAEGLQRTGAIVTSAALLLVVVFAGFLIGGFAPIKAIGLGLVLAIALDATIVRMLLVPATMTLLGRYNWSAPAPLRRLHQRFGTREDEPAAPRPAPVPVR
ncbi:MMPL family transporter [Plantactinospora soyae]|uniref:RND superfamily putative drug exporter n=1 Tax=Plantactinospora soyae TaxID=1544732 RepID=A0A927MEZ4_9ACTN|nr:MMPL family transporter [Plantactinospora soyae]MBE1489895.1 RND superfamily putative drug exporter [Plantactinospora soyae]